MESNTTSSGLPDIIEQMSSAESGLSSRTILMRGRNPKYMQVLDGVHYRIQQIKRNGGTELDLSHLNLTELPDELFKLTSLTSLDISANRLKAIPQQIAQLNNLTLLAAYENPIEKVDDQISQLKSLRTLLLQACNLSQFPKGILRLPNLQTLDLTSNRINWIPVGLKDMDKLEEIQMTGNPILNLPSQFHDTTSARLFNYYKDIEEAANIKGPMLMSVYFDPGDESNKNSEGDRFGEFNPLTKKLLEDSGFMSKSIANPDTVYLFNRLYQYLSNIKILFVLTDQLNQVRSPDGQMQPLYPEDFAEIFACLTEDKVETRLLILDFQNSKFLVDKSTPPNFNIVLSRINGSVTDKDTLPNIFRNLLEGHSLAFVFSEMWKSKALEYRLSYSMTDRFDTIFHSSILGTKPNHDIDTKEFRDLLLLHLLADLYPTKELSLPVAKEAGLNILNIAFSDKPEMNWFYILDQAHKENKLSQLLDTVKAENPSITKLIDPLFFDSIPMISKKEATKRQNELIKAGYKIIADGKWGPQSENAWKEYQFMKTSQKKS